MWCYTEIKSWTTHKTFRTKNERKRKKGLRYWKKCASICCFFIRIAIYSARNFACTTVDFNLNANELYWLHKKTTWMKTQRLIQLLSIKPLLFHFNVPFKPIFQYIQPISMATHIHNIGYVISFFFAEISGTIQRTEKDE